MSAVAGSILVTAGAVAQVVPTPPSVFGYDRTAPLNVTIDTTYARNGFTQTALRYASPVMGHVPAYFYEPAEPADTPAPAILMMHGIPGSRIALHHLAAAYAAAGVYVLAISGPWVRPLPYRSWSMVPAPRFDEYDRRELIQLVQDLRRGVDYLALHPGIDGEHIAFVGHSAGAMAGAVLAGVEDRIVAYVLMAPTPGWVSWLRSRMRMETPLFMDRLVIEPYTNLSPAGQAAWVAGLEPLEATHWIGRAESTPILFQGGTADRIVPQDDVLRLHNEARQPKRLEWYDVSHAMGAAVFAGQARFLAQHLGFDVARFHPPHEL